MGQLLLGTATDSEREGQVYCGRSEEPGSHVYMCSDEHDSNYNTPLTHTLDHPS